MEAERAANDMISAIERGDIRYDVEATARGNEEVTERVATFLWKHFVLA